MAASLAMLPAWAVFSVTFGADDPRSFMQDSLYVPLRTTKATGLGVGLYQVRSLVEAVEGTIRVESQPGQGTVFLVDVPAGTNGR